MQAVTNYNNIGEYSVSLNAYPSRYTLSTFYRQQIVNYGTVQRKSWDDAKSLPDWLASQSEQDGQWEANLLEAVDRSSKGLVQKMENDSMDCQAS